MPQGPFIRFRGRSAEIPFQLFEIDGVDFRVDAIHVSGDTKIMKDEEAEANTSNAFVDRGQGYSITLTDGEMQAARVVVYIVDQSTKVWLDTAIVIDTIFPPGLLYSTDISTLASQTSFTLAEGSSDDDAYNGAMVIIRDQSEFDQRCVGLVSDYTGATRTITLAVDPGIFTIAAGDFIEIIAVPKSLPNAVADDAGGLIISDLGGLDADAQDTNINDIETDLANATDGLGALKDLIDALNDPTLAAIADAIFDEAKAGHVGAGSFGEEIQAHALETTLTAQNDVSPAEVNQEVLDVMNTDTFAEPGQGVIVAPALDEKRDRVIG